jgi:plastocyanin
MDNSKTNYNKKPMWQWLALYAVIAIVVYGGVSYYYYGSKGYTANRSSSNSTLPTSAPNTGALQIDVTGTEFAFSPPTITVKAGKPVRLVFKNMGQYPHNLAIPDLDIYTKTIQPGQQDAVEFTPNKTGSYAFLCTVPGHADQGMRGTLVVQ